MSDAKSFSFLDLLVMCCLTNKTIVERERERERVVIALNMDDVDRERSKEREVEATTTSYALIYTHL